MTLHIVRKLTKLVRLLGNAVYRHGLWYGVAATIEHEPALRSLEFNTLVDVGANTGQFALAARVVRPHSSIIAFEPLVGPARRFKRLFGNDTAVQLYEVAAGEVEQDCEINISARPDSSSLLPISSKQTEIFSGTEQVAKATIRVIRIDNTLDIGSLISPILIKLDVQGFELAALSGMPRLLQVADWVYVEVSFLELYTGQPLANDVMEFLKRSGFNLASVHNLVLDRHGQSVQADFLFVKQGRNLTGTAKGQPSTIAPI